jgi:hypothetical protein
MRREKHGLKVLCGWFAVQPKTMGSLDPLVLVLGVVVVLSPLQFVGGIEGRGTTPPSTRRRGIESPLTDSAKGPLVSIPNKMCNRERAYELPQTW